MLRLAVQPPARNAPGVVLYPPIVARLSSETTVFEELSQIWAVATLIDHHSGETLYDQLGGKVADSAHPMTQAGEGSGQGALRDQAYFYFPDLVIHEPGRYRVRVTLMKMVYSYESPEGNVSYEEYVDSHSITIEEGASNHSRPNSRERAVLRSLSEDGQQVPSPPA